MKRFNVLILSGIVFVILARQADAQVGTLELFGDRSATSCLLAHTPFIESVYVIQTGGLATTGVGVFSAPKPACFNAVWIGDVNPPAGTKIGSSQTSITVAVGVCRPLPAVILEIQYLAGGTSTPCCIYNLALMPGIPLKYTGCDFGERPMILGPHSVTINPDPSCACDAPLATEPSTWGRVKSLYR